MCQIVCQIVAEFKPRKSPQLLLQKNYSSQPDVIKYMNLRRQSQGKERAVKNCEVDIR